MEEELISFETAKLAKEKGLCRYFEHVNGTEYVPAFYSENTVTYIETEFQQEDCTIDDRYFRPTQSLLQKWLREVHDIHMYVEILDFTEGFRFISTVISDKILEKDMSYNEDSRFNTYEEALEDGLITGLKLI